jgi:hypothetical protein
MDMPGFFRHNARLMFIARSNPALISSCNPLHRRLAGYHKRITD